MYNLPTGLELFIYDNGEVLPLQKPNTNCMERLLDITITPAEIAAEIAEKNREHAKGMNLDKIIKEAKGYVQSEDFFEVVATISPVITRSKEDVRLPYFMG